MIKQFMQQVINQAKSNLEEEASGRTKPLSAEPLPFDPSLGQPQPDKKEDDSRAAPVETASLMHREDRAMLQEGGPIDDQMGELMPEIPEEMAEEAPIPLEMEEEAAETQLPDEDMESNYIDFIVDEALDEEEEQYLLDKLSGDDQLSMIFDKVVETASEFSGAGPIEGPGSAVSDSIPARLSDGEFVMTAKATDQIGSNTLQELMSVAEQEADGAQRQTAEAGGLAKAEGSTILGGVSEDERSIALKNKEAMRLLDPRLSLFAS